MEGQRGREIKVERGMRRDKHRKGKIDKKKAREQREDRERQDRERCGGEGKEGWCGG